MIGTLRDEWVTSSISISFLVPIHTSRNQNILHKYSMSNIRLPNGHEQH